MAKTIVTVYYDLQEHQAMKQALADEARVMKVAEVPHFHVILELERLYRLENDYGKELRNRVRARLLASKLAKKIARKRGKP